MSGFVRLAIKYGTQVAKGSAKGTARGSAVVVRAVARPTADFTRGALTGAPKWIPIAGAQGARQTTVGVFTRAGIQTRYIGIAAVRYGVFRTPMTTVRAVKYVIRTTIRDSMVGYYGGVHVYRAFRSERVLRGASTLVERAADRYLSVSGRLLHRVGLAPSLPLTVTSGVRIATIYGLSEGIDYTRLRLQSAEQYLHQISLQYQSITERGPVVIPGTVPQAPPAPPVHTAPAVTPAATTPPVFVPTPAPAPVRGRGGVVVYTPVRR